MADKNLDGSGLSEVWVRAAQLVKRFTGAVNLTKGDLQTQVDTKITGTAISSSSAITTQGEYALDAREKNASIEGTLANQIDALNSNLSGEELDNSTIVLPNDVTLNSAYIKRIGSLVIGKISVKFTPDGTYKTVATLPSKFRPKVSYATHAVCGDYATISDMSAFPTFILDIYQGGMIQMFAPSSNTAYTFAICFAYLA